MAQSTAEVMKTNRHAKSPQTYPGGSGAASVSADDRSVTSFSNSTTSSIAPNHDALAPPPTSIVSTPEDRRWLPFISNNPAVVAQTLEQRDRMEVARAAKAMLYDSYMKALRGEGM